MIDKEYYTYKVIKKFQIYYKPYKFINIDKPFNFYLFSLLDNTFPSYLVKVRETDKLIYFRRVFKTLTLASNKTEIKNIIYVIGRQNKNKKYRLNLFDMKTKQNYKYVGYNLEEAFKK